MHLGFYGRQQYLQGAPDDIILSSLFVVIGFFFAEVHSFYCILSDPDFIQRRASIAAEPSPIQRRSSIVPEPRVSPPRGPRAMKAENVFSVKEIKAERRDEDGTKMYLVSWEGYDANEDTWEYAGSISRKVLKAYREEKSARRHRRRSSVSTEASTRRRSFSLVE